MNGETRPDPHQNQSLIEQIAAGETRFRSMIDTIPAIIWETRPDGYCTYLNQQWYDLTGQTPAEAEGFGWLDATHPDDKAEAGRLFAEANQNRIPFNALYRLRHKDGSFRWAVDKGTPRFGADGRYEGMIGTVVDIHDQKIAEEDVARFKFMADNASDPFILLRQDGTFAYLNQLALDRWGYTTDEAAHLRVPDVDLIYQDDVFNAVFVQAQTGDSQPFETLHRRKDGTIYPVEVNMGGLTLGGKPHMFAVARDITDRKKNEENLRASEQRFQAAIAAVQGVLWTNNTNGEMEGEQPGWAALTGQSYDDYQGYGWAKAVHPDDAQPTVEAWQEAVARRGTFVFEHRVRVKSGHYEQFSIRAIPLLNADGSIREWVGVHTNVTEQRHAEEALRASEAKLRAILANAPIAIGLFMGRDLVVDLPNQAFIDIVGKGPAIVGKPLREVMPELITENQPFLQILDEVYTSGQMFQTFGARVDIVQQGVMTHNFYNINYSPLFNEAGEVYAILDIAVDVTGQVLAQQQIAEAEASLRGAVELAQLGTWSIDAATNGLTYSERLIDWFGYDPKEQAYSEVIPILQEDDRKRVETAVAWALNPASDGVYNEIYTIIHPKTGKKRILHAQGKTVFDATGKAVRMNGTVQDITIQRELQLALENEVQARTRQLQASVQDLERSNQNLQQFAYVASHDLQEPLRKIQSFGDILKSQYDAQLGDGVDYLNRMQAASSRMSMLIKDLLAYSRISTQQNTSALVSLDAVIGAVLTDLELTIQETGAVILVEPLPTVAGDQSQLGQLFQNLLSNALKFRRAGIAPHIRVGTQQVAGANLPPSVLPTRFAEQYHRIDVSDNGIGFDEKYIDRIFQVFQRLHSRSEFAGTGIGLAICEKVAANHGGAITAASQPGQGATFNVYLPME